MSASSRPTRAPSRARLTARLTATVVLPTPPLPDATAIVFLTPGIRSAAGPPNERLTLLAQSTRTGGGAQRLQPVDDVRLDLGLQRAGGRGELDREVDCAAVDVDRLDHPEADQVASDLRILDQRQGGHDVFVGQPIEPCRGTASFPCGGWATSRVAEVGREPMLPMLYRSDRPSAGRPRSSSPARTAPRAGGHRQVRGRQPVVLGGQEAVAHLRPSSRGRARC